jgi:asparagine synthase (glutamine-hydrolysing)
MCGITGFFDFQKYSDRLILHKMTDSLHHRGPDDTGLMMIENEKVTIGLGHKRLSILDLSALGHQPMSYEKLHIVYNGEVYNFKEIRETLVGEGFTFQSDSDTEVILKAFKRWGVDAVKKFIGMFVFVIVDEDTNKAYMFRDRPGIKPFYYYYSDGLLLFSSELKSFHQHPGFRKEIDIDSLSLFLQFSYIPAPHSIFKHTYKLKPGTFLEVDLTNQNLKQTKYWDVIACYNRPKIAISEEDAIQETTKVLESAFRYRLVSDVPVGVFLSGGYDSTAVAAILQKNCSEKIKTFTIGYHESKWNEAGEARKIAHALGTDHTEYYCTAKEAADIIPTLPEIYDEPFADNSAIPTILVSKLARKSIKVAISGDGGDEIFGGYDKFSRAIKFTEEIPVWLQVSLSKCMRLINPEYIPYFNKQYNFSTRYEKVKNIWTSSNAVTAMKYITQYLTDKETTTILSHNYITKKTYFDYEPQLNNRNDSLNKMLAIDYKTFLVDNNLAKVDRATMSVGLEGRVPFLDHRVIEFVSTLPSEFKIRNCTNKYILKKIVHTLVPKELMDRPKMPFLAPLSIWFKDELKELFSYYLSDTKLKAEGYFDPHIVVDLRDRYLNGENVNYQKLWNLLIFQMWKERWL